MDYIVRALTVADAPTVWTMLMYAAHEPSLESVQQQACLARYAQNWGRSGDMGSVACRDADAIGAAWLRLWSGDDRGFGYIEDAIPELAIAVRPEYCGQGIGTQLLQQTLAAAQNLFPAVCLNVRADNPAVKLYQRVGFAKISGSEIVNRTGGVSFNMLCQFSN